MEKKTVVLAGSGITSLACAYYLKQAGMEDFVILERFLEPGGLCRSIQKDGFTFDYTGHVLWRMDAETRKFYEHMLENNLVWVDRKAAVYTHDRFIPYPFQTHLKNLPPDVLYECLYGFFNRDRHLRGVDFESWSLNMFGDGIHKHFMVPFNEKLFGVSMREMTWDWCTDIPSPTTEQILKGAILGETFTQKGNALFGYPKEGGMQALVDAVIKFIGPEKIMTGRTVCRVDPEKKEITHKDFAGNENTIQYDHLVSTITLQKLLFVLSPPNEQLMQFGRNLRCNSVACVMMGFEKPLSDLHWLYVPEKKFPFYRIGFTNNLTPSVAPAGCGSITAEISIPKDATISGDDYVKATLAGLREMGLLKSDNHLTTVHVEYISPAYVQFDLVRKNVPAVLDMLKKMDVHSVGRFGSWGYQSVSDGVAEARVTAKAILR